MPFNIGNLLDSKLNDFKLKSKELIAKILERFIDSTFLDAADTSHR